MAITFKLKPKHCMNNSPQTPLNVLKAIDSKRSSFPPNELRFFGFWVAYKKAASHADLLNAFAPIVVNSPWFGTRKQYRMVPHRCQSSFSQILAKPKRRSALSADRCFKYF
ncbi:hypothetical protein GPK34_04335 [Secundilactobacillus kimchicus]|nr:hypothetical protein [Secundilactobacillus kimchicus]